MTVRTKGFGTMGRMGWFGGRRFGGAALVDWVRGQRAARVRTTARMKAMVADWNFDMAVLLLRWWVLCLG